MGSNGEIRRFGLLVKMGVAFLVLYSIDAALRWATTMDILQAIENVLHAIDHHKIDG